MKQRKLRPRWESLNTEHEYEDDGISVNGVGTTPAQDYELVYDGLTPLQAQVLDDHYDEARHNLNDFEFRDRDGNLHTNARYFSYADPDHTKVDIQSRTIVLRVYPA